jgi:hypothetical protein
VGQGGVSASLTAPRNLDYVMREDDADNTPVRRGSGWILAPYFAVNHWFTTGTSFSSGLSWDEVVGFSLRYSLRAPNTILLEAGYSRYNTTNIDLSTMQGVSSLLSWELRFPVRKNDYDDQLFVGFGVGYEHRFVSPTDPTQGDYQVGIVDGRLRAGYRHLFQQNAGVEFSFDGGGGKPFYVKGNSGSLAGLGMMGLNVALIWGL